MTLRRKRRVKIIAEDRLATMITAILAVDIERARLAELLKFLPALWAIRLMGYQLLPQWDMSTAVAGRVSMLLVAPPRMNSRIREWP